MSEQHNWTPQEMAENIRDTVLDEPMVGEVVGDLWERGDFAWSDDCVYTFTITTASGQVFEVLVRELPNGK